MPPNNNNGNNNSMTSPKTEIVVMKMNDSDDDELQQQQKKKDIDNKELLEEAMIHLKEERLLEAARLLRQIIQNNDSSLLNQKHYQILDDAIIIEQAVDDLLSVPDHHNHDHNHHNSSSRSNGENETGDGGSDGGWKKQGESSRHSKYETTIYYKIQDGSKLTCRMETPVPSNLLIPLLSVLNESSLYHTWIPSWKYPFHIGLKSSKQLSYKKSRGHQIIQIQCNVPWPMKCREVLMDVIAIDDIQHQGFIIAKMRTLKSKDGNNNNSNNNNNNNASPPQGNDNNNNNENETEFQIPSCPSNMERVEFDGALLFRQCPIDHPHYESSQLKFPSQDLLLLQYTVYFDAHMSLVPTTLINFITRTVIGHVWNMLLSVAEQVRDGKRPQHNNLIEGEKSDFYDWVKQRCDVMLHGIQQQQQQNQEQQQQDDYQEVDNPIPSSTTQPVPATTTTQHDVTKGEPSLATPSPANHSDAHHFGRRPPSSIIVTTNSSSTASSSNNSNNKVFCRHDDDDHDEKEEIQQEWSLKDVLQMSL